ncbi:hypothetical protein [Actinoplanes regularis]|uniref:hypothetical protein n=1 Tax=Actinoplanes regularis TaxID=52697 RepID=UPI0024A0051B|nr:hypothetical protein [Actinoplanes regularis]GLW34281.1 hypothetical protein Areg01_72180 [Actinoplanes regularis]
MAAVPDIEWNTAVEGTPPSSGLNCVSTTGATACLEAYGDILWVKDTAADSASAVADWDNYVGGTLTRWGYCRNSPGSGKWAYCNKNFTEGSELRLRAAVYDGSEGTWIRWSGTLYLTT